MSSWHYARLAPQDQIRKLEEDVYRLRRSIIDLMPENLEKLLGSYYSAKSKSERYQWVDQVADEITNLATPLEPPNSYFSPDRARCPLCGGTSQSPYADGFTLPIGLQRHLVGYGNVHQCPVFEAAEALARDYWHREYAAADAEEEAKARQATLNRKRLEVVYQIEPGGDPVLLEEGLWSEAPRSEEELAFAVARLDGLGFRAERVGNGVKHTLEQGDLIVYADPRRKGKIEFRVYRQVAPKGKSRTPKFKYLRVFSIQDSWSKGIREKFQARLPE